MDRLSPVQKHDAAQRLITLCAEAMRLRHPKAMTFRFLRPSIVQQWPDERLLNAIETMQTWISEQG